jgi:hypothetical protein
MFGITPMIDINKNILKLETKSVKKACRNKTTSPVIKKPTNKISKKHCILSLIIVLSKGRIYRFSKNTSIESSSSKPKTASCKPSNFLEKAKITISSQQIASDALMQLKSQM